MAMVNWDPWEPEYERPEAQSNFTQPSPAPPQQYTPPAAPTTSDPWGNDENIRNDPYGFARHHFSFMAPTTQNLELIYNALNARQVPVRWATHAGGTQRSDDKFYIGDTMYDWISDVGGPGAAWSGAAHEGPGVPSGGMASSYNAAYGSMFNDPSSQLYQQYLQKQMAALDAQQAEQAKRNADLQARMPAIQQATDRLIAYMNQRATNLQGAPYTGTEQEILRTQALDPIERDRGAAQKRALERIGARGLTPESGIAQQLMNDVDSVYDRQRAGAQNDLAYRTIHEQRIRQQEAQSILGLIPQLQRAAATGDLDFLQALDAAVNQPANQAIGLANLNYQMPRQSLQDALAVMGMGPGAGDLFGQAMSLWGAQQNQRNQGAGYYEMLGAMLPYLMG